MPTPRRDGREDGSGRAGPGALGERRGRGAAAADTGEGRATEARGGAGPPGRGGPGPGTTGRHSGRVGGVWRVLCRVPPRPDVCLQGYAAVTRGLGPGDKSRPGDNSADPGESWKKIH